MKIAIIGTGVSGNYAAWRLAREHDIILGLENHYKDGYWEYPEFAQISDLLTNQFLI